MKRMSLAAVLAVAFAAPASADLAGGLAALQAAQYDKAYAELKPLAEGGDGEAQFRLGQMFESGWGVPASYQQALIWYRRAADRGHVDATVRVAECYLSGLGVPRSRREAYDWYMKAAQKGNAKAMTLVGRWNLEGIAKRPNFLVAKLWLNKAAAAGDAEAQDLIDQLASKNYPILDVPGTAEPTEEMARRILAELNNLLEPMLQAPPGSTKLKLGQPAAIAKAADGGHLVTLPMVELGSDQGTWRLGTLQMVFTPDGDDYAVEVRLPGQSRLVAADGHERGRLRIDGRKMTGKWSTTLHTLTDHTTELAGWRYESAEGQPWMMTADTITAKRSYTALDNGRYDISEMAEASGVRTEGGIGPGKRTMRLAGAAYSVRYSNLDIQALGRVAAQFGIDWRTYTRLPGAELPESVPQMLGGVEVGFKLRDMVTEDASGQRVSALAGSELTLAGGDFDTAVPHLSIRYSHDGMIGTGEAELLPARAELALTARNVPVGEVVAAGLSWMRGTAGAPGRKSPKGQMPKGQIMVSAALPLAMPSAGSLPDLFKLTRAARDARSDLRFDKVTLSGDGYTVALSGSLTPAPDGGLAGKLDVAVNGLDRLTGGEPAAEADGQEVKPTLNPVAWLGRVKAMAIAEKDGGGADVKVFRFAFLPDGKVTVNGKDASRLLGWQ